jgi:hypothetical protein
MNARKIIDLTASSPVSLERAIDPKKGTKGRHIDGSEPGFAIKGAFFKLAMQKQRRGGRDHRNPLLPTAGSIWAKLTIIGSNWRELAPA